MKKVRTLAEITTEVESLDTSAQLQLALSLLRTSKTLKPDAARVALRFARIAVMSATRKMIMLEAEIECLETKIKRQSELTD